MRINQFLATFFACFVVIGCNAFNTAEPQPNQFERRDLPRALTQQETELVSGGGRFGFDLVRRLVDKDPNGNHLVSPLSILMAYGMTMNGAGSKTYTQMRETFGMGGMSREEVNQSARELMDLLVQFDDNVRFEIANAIWYRDTFSVEDEFLETNQLYYDATIEAADFADPETVSRINSWVDDKTGGLINNIVQGPIDPLTVMYLANAIYFKGNWTYPFDPENTRQQPFYRSGESSVESEMMQMEQQDGMLYKKGDNYEAVNLYYGDAGFAMTLVLPDESMKLEDWIGNLDWNRWQEVTEGFSETTLNLELPKFEMEYEIDAFRDVLRDMGITDAFDPLESDFSGINPESDDLHISETRHKTFIRVDEEGTEAAAATSVGIGITSVPQTTTVRFNRPFFYVIREVESQTILFAGTMSDPTSG
ncbi:serpin family protein [Halalkalibaculum sp. DA384]|uniref:serpin family protein n=1 Tax=Halalkalibaculum sp. DA384 TaxID=3373606 RepID=UPI003753F6F3